MAAPTFLLVTDLDGTLLDHEHYSFDAAVQALSAARRQRVPIVFNTSKTLAECLQLKQSLKQQELGMEDPIIYENGAGVALPITTWPEGPWSRAAGVHSHAEHWVVPLAPSYEHIRGILQSLRRNRHFRFTGFGDMTTAQVRDATGLTLENAAAARERHFDEPLLWQDIGSRSIEFTRAVEDAGLQLTRGGRFLHVMGAADKGRAMLWLARQYSTPRPQLVALGDSENDLPMLRAADIAVLVRSPAQQLPELCTTDPDDCPGRVVITDEVGPAGWNTAVLSLLEELTGG